jgi:signal transduction histidine kinase/DNA-binding response OmpR family regulator
MTGVAIYDPKVPRMNEKASLQHRSERILVLAPIGRDASLACELLIKEGFLAESCRDMKGLCNGIVAGAGAAVIAQESLSVSALEKLVNTLAKQPAWSDFPLMILTTADSKDSQFSVLKPLNQVANYTLLERPLRVLTLVTATHAALKARRRQYQIRDNLWTLQENEERIRMAVTAANMGSWRANLTTGLATRDANLNNILGGEAVETAQPIDDRFQTVHPDDRPAAIAAWRRAVESKGVYAAEFRLLREEGAVQWLREQGRFVHGHNGSPDLVTGVAIDISDQKRAEEVLKETDRRKNEFLANMSHEIRTPMTSILGYADILLSHLKDPDDVECVQTIKQSGNYLLEIINDILDLSKIESGELKVNHQAVSLPTLLSEIYNLMIVRAKEKSLALILRYDGALPENIASDRVRLRQILINLVSNAIKFTEHGSVQIVARFIAETSSLEFEVLDTGIGIAKEMQQHLFEPFAQADTSATREYGGTGLGLAITKRLVDMMGGTIAFATQINRGTAFRVAIPTHALDATTIRLPRSLNPAQSWIANSPLDCRVLVVDDRREIRYLVRQFIEEAGGRAYTVGDGHSSFEAIQSAARENQPFDIVLMDMQMPGLDGYEATRQLRAQGFSRPIIALTADAMKGNREKCLEAGCDDYLSKPIDREILVEMVARYTSSAQNDSAAGSERVVGKRSLKILLVDDSRTACTAIGRLLESSGYRVRMAFDGKSALSTAQNFDADIVMLDFKLPDTTGYELLKELKKLKSLQNAKFFAVSGLAREDIQNKDSPVDFDHFITKPVDVSYMETLF